MMQIDHDRRSTIVNRKLFHNPSSIVNRYFHNRSSIVTSTIDHQSYIMLVENFYRQKGLIWHLLYHHQKLNIFVSTSLIQTNSFWTSSQLYKLPAWWKTSQGPLLTKTVSFQSSEASKTVKSKLCSFCELPAWWKTSQGPLLTKTESFQRSETSKAVKGGPGLVFHQAGSSQNEQSLLFRAFETSDLWK